MDGESHSVMIVDADLSRVEAMHYCLRGASGLIVTGEARNVEEALQLYRAHSPNAVLVGLPLGDCEAPVLLCRGLQDFSTNPSVLLYGEYAGTGQQELAYLLSGANGFVNFKLQEDAKLDPDVARSLARAVESVIQGESITADLIYLEETSNNLASLLGNE